MNDQSATLEQPAYLRFEPRQESVPETATQLSIRHLDFYYGRAQALHDVNLEIKANAVTAIIVLLTITFILNGIAVYLRNRWQKRMSW
jgi:ABC-type multidrug transport system fused ATPase/permease subunit